MKAFLRKNIWLFLIIALALLFPQSLSTQAELNTRMIISGIGIDFGDDNYEITAQVILPSAQQKSSGINAKIDFVSSNAQTLAQGISEISNKLGKTAELSHTEYILIGDGIENKNLVGELDYFFRNFKLKNSIMLLSSTKPAKETMKNIGKLDMGAALSMQKIFISSQDNMGAIAKTYVDFINQTYKPSATSQIDTLDFEEDQGDSAKIQLNSPVKLFKNGVFVRKIEDKNQIIAFYLCNKHSKSGNYQLKNFSFGDAFSCNINIRIDQYSCRKNVTFDTYPVLKIDIKIAEAHIDELSTNSLNKNLYKSYLSKDLQEAIISFAQNKIKQDIYSLFEMCKTIDYDIFEIETLCYNKDKNKLAEYKNGLDEHTTFLDNVQLDVSVDFDIFR